MIYIETMNKLSQSVPFSVHWKCIRNLMEFQFPIVENFKINKKITHEILLSS